MTATASTEVEATAPEAEAEHPQKVDVTAVLANVAAGEALRTAIKRMTAELKSHEDLVKDVLGSATEGTDATGKTVVRFPFRNRSDLDRKLVKTMLTDEQYAMALREGTYRTLLYGE